MDTGPLLSQYKIPIAPEDDAESLRAKLVLLGVEALGECLVLLKKQGKVVRPQVGSPSRAPMLTKDDGRIRWDEPAARTRNRIRGTTPWPGSYTIWKTGEKENRIKIIEAQVLSGGGPGQPGTIVRLESGHGMVIKCGKTYSSSPVSNLKGRNRWPPGITCKAPGSK